MLALASLLLIGVALWMRRAPEQSGSGGARPADPGLTKLRRGLDEELLRLGSLASAALAAPAESGDAFGHLAALRAREGSESIVLFDSRTPLAWVGESRTRVDTIRAPISVTQDAFFTIAHVVKVSGARRAVASAVISVEPPATRLASPLAHGWSGDPDSRVRYQLASAPGPIPRNARPIIAAGGRPLLYALPLSVSSEELRFKRAARMRAGWGGVLIAGFLLLLAAGWRQRHDLPLRLATIGVGLLLTGLVPWSEFSNSSRAFDPGFYFSRVGGPYTANAAALLATVLLLLMAVFAVTRSRPRFSLPPLVAGAAAVAILATGIALGSNIVRGVGQPAWGSTPGLWLSWELPVFLFLFAVLIATASLARRALGKGGAISARSIIAAAVAAAVVATAALWATTTQQRMRLAERDLAALTRVDESEDVLARRFLQALARTDAPNKPSELLRLYAASELSAAEFPVVLETRSAADVLLARLDLAPGATDTATAANAARMPIDSGATTTFLGLTGVQTAGRAVHPGGEITTAIVLPHTRLIAPAAFVTLLGIPERGSGDPPYTVSLTEANPALPADMRRVIWKRIGDEWHGDRLVPTSAGIRRAHVEVDLRSLFARGERGVLIVLLNVILAGLLWLAGAAVERPFPRWLRMRGRKWMHTYRARLTLALFTFFVVPALAFALWSYQRLRSDDRQTRELLVNETLATIGEGPALDNLPEAGARFDAPLFLYSSGFLEASSDSLYASLAPGGITLPPDVQLEIGGRGELTASAQQEVGGKAALFGYRAVRGPNEESLVLAAPARGDDLVLDRRRRDLGMLVLFSTALGAVAALWLSGIAAKTLARDLELSRIEVARAERVIAWGEMARQIAHEIKNPLTPIRLGVQHLRRARSDNRADFDKVLDENVGRILSEIDRLDSIARSFSRYGSAPADLLPAERLDVCAVVRDVVALEQMGKSELKWRLRGADQPMIALARAEELREVMLNVLENARLAGAKRVDITIREEEKRVTIETCDDGAGITAAALPRIFEPHFSTRTTGSGLGLATSRKIIEHGGGEIAITSEAGKGARVLVALARGTS